MTLNASDSIGFKLAQIVKMKRHLIDLTMEQFSLCRSQWQTLFWLHKLGQCSQKELLNKMDIDKGHLARILNEFEQKKYITRIAKVNDRRSLVITITEYTQKTLFPHLEKAFIEEDAVLLRGLSERNKSELQALLAKIAANLEGELSNNRSKADEQ